MAFPTEDPAHLPNKDEMAAYLESYADRFDFPNELETRVTDLDRADGTFLLETTGEDRRADQVVVGTGAHSSPALPPFADELPEEVLPGTG